MIDIGGTFIDAVKLVWKHKFLWLFGLLVGLNGLVVGVGRLLLRPLLPPEWLQIEYWLGLIENPQSAAPMTLNLNPTPLLLGLVLLFVYVTLLWLIMTLAEGGIIATAVGQTEQQPLTGGQALRRSLGYLGRFAAIDALVFFPLFILMLIILAVGFVDTALLAYLTLQTQTETATAVAVYVVGWAIMLGLSCCMIPLTIGGSWYRRLGFVDAALHQHGPKQAIRHVWQVVRQRWGELVALTVILYGLDFVLGWLFSFLTLPVVLLTAVPLATGLLSFTGFLAASLNLLVLLLVAFLKGMVHAVVIVVWTLAYYRLSRSSEAVLS